MIDLKDVKEIVNSDVTVDALRKYKYVTGALFNLEVSADYTFQKAYCDLYKFDGYSEKFKTEFFFALEEMKNMCDISFREAFERLRSIENKNEMAAASVLVHTISPRFAIWDDKLAKELFQIEIPEPDDSVERYCKRYNDFSDKYYDYTNSAEGGELVKAFDTRFPNAEVPDVIKVGIVIWQLES